MSVVSPDHTERPVKASIRTWVALTLAATGFLAATGLKHTFGTGEASPALKRELLLRSVFESGRDLGFGHGVANGVSSNVDALARNQSEILNENTPRGDELRREFCRGYAEGIAAANAERNR